jgi:hypothetical protein
MEVLRKVNLLYNLKAAVVIFVYKVSLEEVKN